MELSRLHSTTPAAQIRSVPSKEGDGPDPDQFHPQPPEDPQPPRPSSNKKAFAAASLTGTAGMFIGAKWGASLGNPGLGFLIGTLVGGGLGFAIAKFGYSEPA